MNEMTMNSACMYDEVEGIRSLNKVEGFDPRKYMRLIQNEGQAGKYYLDVAYRKLWFRLRYPEGKIVKKILKLTEQVAIVEARVYLDRNDHEDNFISNALAQKYMSADGQFGNKFVELAETAAVGRALSDAGFGLQFADREGDMDPEVTEAPFDPQMIAGAGGALPEGTYMDSALQEGAAGDGEVLQEEAFPGQYGIEEYIPMPEEVGQAMKDLRKFMLYHVYLNPKAKGEEDKAVELIRRLYEYYIVHPELLPEQFLNAIGLSGSCREQIVCDYIAGMTDNYAVKKYEEYFMPEAWSK